MTLRRYGPMKQSAGTTIPLTVRMAVLERDRYCVCDRAYFPGALVLTCPRLPVELDHVRASHGMGMKSETTEANLVALSGQCHLWKTTHGREARELLLAYLERVR